MMTTQILGKYGERSNECEYLTLAFSPLQVPLRSRWRNNGLSADFLGDYVITFLPAKGGMAAVESQQNEIKYAVTYIANELLENAMKYHAREVDVPIRIHLELTSDHITVSVNNSIAAGQAERYKDFAEHLLAGDPGDMLLRQQEESAKCDDSTTSCVGLLTIISDYEAQLGWRFDPHPVQSQVMTVTTSAVLRLKSIPGGAA